MTVIVIAGIKKSNSIIALLVTLIFLSSISTSAFLTGNVNFFNMVSAKNHGSSSTNPTQNEETSLINKAAPTEVLPNQKPAQGQQQPRLPTYNGKILSTSASTLFRNETSPPSKLNKAAPTEVLPNQKPAQG